MPSQVFSPRSGKLRRSPRSFKRQHAQRPSRVAFNFEGFGSRLVNLGERIGCGRVSARSLNRVDTNARIVGASGLRNGRESREDDGGKSDERRRQRTTPEGLIAKAETSAGMIQRLIPMLVESGHDGAISLGAHVHDAA